MKATIDLCGYMTIIPETELEAYALSQWTKENYSTEEGFSSDHLIITTNIEEKNDGYN